MDIRKAQADDLERLRQLAIRTYKNTFEAHNTEADMLAFLNEVYGSVPFRNDFFHPGAHIWVAWEQQEMVGFLWLRENDEVENLLGSSTLELQRLYIDAPYKGKKVGSLLMEIALETAAQMEKDWIWLGVWEKNFKAQAFYKKWGFERFSEHTFMMGTDPQIDWLFKRPIRSSQ